MIDTIDDYKFGKQWRQKKGEKNKSSWDCLEENVI
jgi:hypothetical protein